MARRYNDGNIVRFEKRSTNKIGLFFLFIIVLGGLGFGGYYLYQHRSEIDWELKLPWQKENSNNESSSENNSSSSSKNNRDDLVLPNKYDKTENVSGGTIRVYDIKLDDKGYTISVDYTNPLADTEFVVEKVLVNGFETSSSFTISETLDPGSKNAQLPTTTKFRILRTELEPLKITGLKKLTFFYRRIQNGEESTLERREFTLTNNIDFKTELEGLINIYKKDKEFTLNYYETITDQDNTYIYFDIKNDTYNSNKQVRIKKLIINGELYDYQDLDFKLYRGAENIFSIVIPKSKIKEVESFTVSFFITSYLDDEVLGIYMTNDYTKTI